MRDQHALIVFKGEDGEVHLIHLLALHVAWFCEVPSDERFPAPTDTPLFKAAPPGGTLMTGKNIPDRLQRRAAAAAVLLLLETTIHSRPL